MRVHWLILAAAFSLVACVSGHRSMDGRVTTDFAVPSRRAEDVKRAFPDTTVAREAIDLCEQAIAKGQPCTFASQDVRVSAGVSYYGSAFGSAQTTDLYRQAVGLAAEAERQRVKAELKAAENARLHIDNESLRDGVRTLSQDQERAQSQP